MKALVYNRLIGFAAILVLFSSCANLYLEKRRYNRGFHLSVPWTSGQEKSVKQTPVKRISKKKGEQSKELVTHEKECGSASKSESECGSGGVNVIQEIDRTFVGSVVSSSHERVRETIDRKLNGGAFVPDEMKAVGKPPNNEQKVLVPDQRVYRMTSPQVGDSFLFNVVAVLFAIAVLSFLTALVGLGLHIFGVALFGFTAKFFAWSLLIALVVAYVSAWLALEPLWYN